MTDPRLKAGDAVQPSVTGGIELVLHQERSAGAFARVYLAEANSADGISRIVAVKVLKDRWGENPELLERTRDEARLLARLRHKNILRVEALTTIDGRPAVVMEFVDGVDLKQIIRALAPEGAKIPPKVAYRIADRIGSALDAAYAQVPYGLREPMKVVHRDIKPSNVMLSVEGEVKVLDFGTARFSHEIRAAHTSVLRFGSMKYMTPERKTGDRGDHSSDVYALGLVLIEMLTLGGIDPLPADRRGHDEALGALLQRVTETALPDERWTATLKQTLSRMCAYNVEERITAGQACKMLSAFAEQAAGPSLEAFSDDVVSRVTRQVFGDVADGVLSGSRVFVRPDGAPDPASSAPPLALRAEGPPARSSAPAVAPEPSVRPASPPAPQPHVPLGDAPTMVTPMPAPSARSIGIGGGPPPFADLPPPPPMAHPAERRPAAPQPAPAPAPEPWASPAQAQRIAASPPVPKQHAQQPYAEPQRSVHAPQQGFAAVGAPPPPGPAPSPWAAPISAGGPQPDAPPRPTPAPKKGGNGVLIALVAGVVTFGLLCALGGVGLTIYRRSAGAPVEGPAPAPPASGAAALSESTVALTVANGSDRIQWIRVEDEAGAVVFDSKAQATAELPTGAYRMSAKVVGRGKVSAAIQLDAAVRVACKPDAERTVTCMSDDEAVVWLLSP